MSLCPANVKVFPAVAAGVVTGIMWFAVYWAYIVLQVGLTNYNTIYGTFAAVHFLPGLAIYQLEHHPDRRGNQLCGAELPYDALGKDDGARFALGICTILGTMVVLKVCQAFRDGEGGWKALDFARENGI